MFQTVVHPGSILAAESNQLNCSGGARHKNISGWKSISFNCSFDTATATAFIQTMLVKLSLGMLSCLVPSYWIKVQVTRPKVAGKSPREDHYPGLHP